jgi:hypothetical protein
MKMTKDILDREVSIKTMSTEGSIQSFPRLHLCLLHAQMSLVIRRHVGPKSLANSYVSLIQSPSIILLPLQQRASPICVLLTFFNSFRE